MNNGRVNIMGVNNADRFLLYERVAPKKTTNYDNALVGNFQSNQLSKHFFSGRNIDLLQEKMREGVSKKSSGRFIIGRQDDDALKTIMRAMYLQFSKNLDYNIAPQVEELNNHVLDYAIPQIYSEAVSYLKYKRDVSHLATPIDLPVSSYHSNSLQLKPFF